MDTGKIRNQYDETIDSTQPIPVLQKQASEKTSVSETLTYNGKAAAGAISINAAAQSPIISIEGDQIASHWELKKNQVYKAIADGLARANEPKLTSVTETNGSAAVVINDADKDLELLFESLTTTVKRYVLKVTDKSGGSLYGWIFGVAKLTNVYTIDVVNNRLTETQNWVGTLADFDNTALAKVEIFRYNSPLTFGTGTTLTEEVVCPREFSKSWQSAIDYAENNLSNGQYFVDYLRGRIIGKKADTTASETITYNVGASSSSVSLDAEKTDDGAFTPGTDKVLAMGAFADETATDSVNEGDIGIIRMTLDRRLITAGQKLDDAAFGVGTDYITPTGYLADETASDSVDEGDVGLPRMTLNRRPIGAGNLLDDSAFGVGTDYVSPVAFLADETATDSIDEGDVGLPRMTLNRRPIGAGNILDDAAFGIGTDYVNPTGFLADETAADSVDEGDVGLGRMTLDRKQLTANQHLDDAAFGVGTGYVGVIGALVDETSADSADEGDVGAVRMTADRQLRVAPGSAITGVGNPVIDSYTHASFNLAAGADQVLVSSAANKQIWVYGIGFTVNVAGTVSFQDEDNTAITGIMQFGATGGMAVSPSGNFAMPIWKLGTDKDLEVDVVTSELDGWIAYAIVSV